MKTNKQTKQSNISDEQLKAMADVIAQRVAINTKTVLTFKEACTYTGLSNSALYKQTMLSSVPHYKPNGKKMYFKRVELDKWLLQNRCATDAELNDKAEIIASKLGGE